jgi:hypothetical protein
MSDGGLYFICCRNHESASFKRGLFEEIFSRGAFIPSSRFSDIEYEDGFTDVCIKDDDEIDGMSFRRSWGDTFIANMLDLADRTGAFIVDLNNNLFVTDLAVQSHMPRELLEDLHKWSLQLVRTPKDFRKVIGWVEPDPERLAEWLARSAADRAAGVDRPDLHWPFLRRRK